MPTEEQMKDQAQQQQGQQQGQDGQKQGQPSPGLKDREAETSDSYGNTRDSGETPK